MDLATSVRYSGKAGRQRQKHHWVFPKKIYLRVIVPAPKEYIKYSSNYTSYRSSATPRRYTMVAKEMSFELGKITRHDTYGEIRLAHSTTSSKTIAVKCIRKDHSQMQNYVKYILPREIALLKMLKGHPNVVSFIGVMEADHYAMVAMEHIEGMSLIEYISKNHVIKEEKARLIFKELLNTVITCHSMGISIRSLACHNVLLNKSLTPKVSTLEHAIVRGYDKVDIFEGTSYSPPEIFEGSEYDSKLVDVWSLGIILYTMVTGTEPCFLKNFDQSKPYSLTFPQYLSYECRMVIKRMLHPSPQSRTSVSELKRDEWLNNAMLKSVEYKLENSSDSDLEGGDGRILLSSSKLKLMCAHHSRSQHSAPLVDCDLCKSSYNMRSSKNVESAGTSARDGGGSRERKAVIDYEEADSQVGSQPIVMRRVTSRKTLSKDKGCQYRERCEKPRSFSAGTLSSDTNRMLIDKLDNQKRISMVGSSKSVASVVCDGSDEKMISRKSSISGVSYSDIQHFLSEELKQLADTTKALNEEKRFLDLFDQCMPPASESSVLEPLDSEYSDSVIPRCLLNKSTSCLNRSLVDQSTSYSVRSASTINRILCDAGVEAVVGRADQHVQCTRSGLAEKRKAVSTVSTQVPAEKDSEEYSKVLALPSELASGSFHDNILFIDDPSHAKPVSSPVTPGSHAVTVMNGNQQFGPMSQASKTTEVPSRLPGKLNGDPLSSAPPISKNSSINNQREGADTSIESEQKKGSMLRRLFSWGLKRSSSHSQNSSHSRGKKNSGSHLSSSNLDYSIAKATPAVGSEIASGGMSQNKTRHWKKHKGGKVAGEQNAGPVGQTGRKKDSVDVPAKFWSSKGKHGAKYPAKEQNRTARSQAAGSQI